MAERTLKYSAGMFLIVLLLLSCAKLPEAPTVPTGKEGGLKMEVLPLGNTIPLQWGDLIAVSNVNQYPAWIQLWFKDKEGNVYMVPYDIEANRFQTNYRYFKRR